MRKIYILLFFLYTLSLSAQVQYRSPLDIPLILSANFGELRPNHFHSGIDLKTQGVVNKPVFSIEDGYISRISVSPYGYGLALYINHPTGQTSLYGHLNRFAPNIAKYVKEKQYELESYRIDVSLKSEEIPVKKGDLIAYSGNTGSSGGPHVHFEIRNTENQLALDPLVYYKDEIKDNASPQLRGIAIYPISETGVVNNSNQVLRKTIEPTKGGKYAPIKEKISAWGKIGIGVNTIDRMTDTHNIYGVKVVKLFCDDKEIFRSDISSVNFDNTRMINSMIDFDYWYKKKSYYQKSFIEPGNKLPIYSTINNGYIDINEEKEYNFRYELEDLYGNKTVYAFNITGKKQNIPDRKPCSMVMAWNYDNRYISDNFHLTIPKEYLYEDINFILQETPTPTYLSNRYIVNNTYVPLHASCNMKIKMTKDSLVNKNQYGIVRINGTKEQWIGGKYENGYITAGIRELGHTYAVSTDTKAPVITPVQPERWVRNKEIKIKIADDKSGIATWKGTIDDSFVLFEHDMKSTTYSYKFDIERLKSGKTHKLIFTASDACGNTTIYEYSFKY